MTQAKHSRRASFPEAGQECDQHIPVASTGRFEVAFLKKGRPITMLIDMSTWPRPRLARAFAAALRDYLRSPSTVCTRDLIRKRLTELHRFWQFLDTTPAAIDDVRSISPTLMEGYEHWLAERAGGGGTMYQRNLLSGMLRHLRGIEENRPGTLTPDMVERCAYVSLEPVGRVVPRDAYSGAVAEKIRQAARTQVRAAASRITLDGELPRVPADVHPRVHQRYRQVIARFSKLGWIKKSDSYYQRLKERSAYWSSPAVRWPALPHLFYLNIVDLIAFMSLLALETGLELECLMQLKADCLKNPIKGSVEIEYLKRRARGNEHKRLRVRDGGVNTPGGLIRLALSLTARARRRVGTDALWVYACKWGLRDSVHCPKRISQYFVRQHDLLDDAGRPLNLEFHRLRKTHKAEWYIKTQGQLDEFAVGHSIGVAANHYADIPALRHVHEQTVADALKDALDDALKATIILPVDEQEIREDPRDTGIPNMPEEVVAFLDGAQDVWLASCSGFYASPFASKGQPCPVPFWGCLECTNAVITGRKLPALIAFLDFIVAQREVLSAADWSTKFRRAHRRIAEQILPAFPDADVAAARAVARASFDAIYLPPEARAR